MNKTQGITDCEILVMVAIYALEDKGEDVSMQEISEYINSEFDKNWKTQTVSTFLTRLRGKGFLDMHRRGRIFFYQSIIKKQDLHRSILDKYARLLYNGDMEKMLTY